MPWWEWLLVFGLCALPLVAGRFLPLIDIPQHLAMAKAVVGLLQGDTNISKYYFLDLWPQPYWLYYILVGAVSKFAPLEIANKLVLYGYSIGIPFGVRSLLLVFNRNPRWWILAVPLAWTSSFFYGFMAYLVGVPLVLFGITALQNAFGGPQASRQSKWILGTIACLIYLAHAQAYLWFLLAATVLLFIHWKGSFWFARMVLPLFPSLALFIAWVWRTFMTAKPAPTTPVPTTYGSLGNLGMRWEPFTRRVTSGMEHLYGGCTDGSGLWIGWLWLAVIASGILLATQQTRPLEATGSATSRRGSFAVEALLGAFLLAWLFLPYELNGQWYLAPRYLLFSGAVAIVAAAGHSRGHRTIFLVGLCAVAAFSLNVTRMVRQFQPAMAGLDEVLHAIPAGERVAHLPFDERNNMSPDGIATNGIAGYIVIPTSISMHGYAPMFPGSPTQWMSPTHHASAYYQVWQGGDIAVSFAAAPTNPVRYRPGKKPEGLVEFEPENVEMDVAIKDFAYFLVRGNLEGKATRLGQYADRIAVKGSWEVWRRR